jgi:hypothetical protein
LNTILFEENQRFREIAFYILLAILQILFLWGLTQQVIFQKPWGTKPAGDSTLIIINLGVLALNLLLVSINLRTVITDKYLSVRIFPFQIKDRIIKWCEIKKIKIIKYDGIRDYWGYGLRYMPGKGWCYTISGNLGIKLTLTDNKEILIGTHKTEEISQIIDELKIRGIIPGAV